MSAVDRAIVEGDDEGFLKVHVKRGKDEILGATLVSRHAGKPFRSSRRP
jgi:pyruvate/2-oxoglutarate dehydrogenase complex dihydrolipoamide dehydrogenase (E3) component